MTHELGPLPEPDGTAEVNQQPLPGGGYSLEVADAWSEPLIRAYTLAEVKKAVKAERERCAQIVAGTKFRDGQLDARRGPDGVGTWHERSPMGVTMRALVRAILGDGT